VVGPVVAVGGGGGGELVEAVPGESPLFDPARQQGTAASDEPPGGVVLVAALGATSVAVLGSCIIAEVWW
jgi:hypothetical protein